MRIASLVFAALAATALPALAQSAYSGHGHAMVRPAELAWADAPSVGPGAQIAVIEGPLNQAVPFTFRLRMPANTKVAPHTPGSVAIMPPGAPMFGYTREETVIQLHGVGPWGLRYLDPKDDPRRN